MSALAAWFRAYGVAFVLLLREPVATLFNLLALACAFGLGLAAVVWLGEASLGLSGADGRNLAPQVTLAAQPVRVTCDNQSSQQATILEVFAHDAPGLLYGIAKAMYDAGLSVQAAKIGTYLDQVVDAFHVTESGGGRIVDPARQGAIRAAIERAVAAAGPL